jgi:hypothetical protein
LVTRNRIKVATHIAEVSLLEIASLSSQQGGMTLNTPIIIASEAFLFFKTFQETQHIFKKNA